MPKKWSSVEGGKSAKRLKNGKGNSNWAEGTHEEVLLVDVQDLFLRKHVSDEKASSTSADSKLNLPQEEKFSEVEVLIEQLSSTGDGLGFVSSSTDHVYVVPFSLPGDIVLAKTVRRNDGGHFTMTDFIRVIRPSPFRNDSAIKCPYFARCGGCQFQMMSYDAQLAHKKVIIEKSFRNFSGLIAEAIPIVRETIGSPLQYGYRTKLTPHFDGPSFSRHDRRNGLVPKFSKVPPIGFMQKGLRKTLDIEDCPIATEAVRQGLKHERKRVAKDIEKYRKGATLLLRQNTMRKLAHSSAESSEELKSVEDRSSSLEKDITTDKEIPAEIQPSSYKATNGIHGTDISGLHTDNYTCITDSKAVTTEYVGSYILTNPAGAFFQNNNSILPVFTQYIRDHIKPSPSEKPLTHLIDAYCGSGLFTVTLSKLFESSIGIDIAAQSIEFARKNAEMNSISNAIFMTATASEIFASVRSDPDLTAVIIDPPRKGCDQDFLRQLMDFGPRKIVYVSCNVHTQARDAGVLVEGNSKGTRYTLLALQGFDFFPQTSHVEGVAVLQRT